MALKQMTMQQAVRRGRCSRCDKRIHKDVMANVTVKHGVIVGFLCSNCQTGEEQIEAAVNESLIDYSTMTTNAFGQMVARYKAV